MISPPPLYCQFIKEDKQNSVDPPQKTDPLPRCGTDDNRRMNAQRSNRNSNNSRRDRYKTQLQ